MGCSNGCCCCKSGTPDKGLPGIKQNRWPTDILFLALFVFSFGILVTISQIAAASGADINRVLFATDIHGNVCGLDNATIDQPYGAWPNPMEYKFMICVSDCNYTSQCDSDRMAWRYESEPYMGSYCLPLINGTIDFAVSASGSGFVGDAFSQGSELFARAMADLKLTEFWIMISPGVCIVFAFAFMVLLRYCAGVLTAISLFFLMSCAGFLGYMLYSYPMVAVPAGDLTVQEGEYVTIAGYIVWGLLGLFTIVMFFLREQLKIAVAIVKEAAHAVNDMKLIIFFPILPVVFLVAYLFLWIYGALYFVSVRNITEGDELPSDLKVYGVGFESCFDMLTARMLATGTFNMLAVPNGLDSIVNSTTYVRDEIWQYYGAYHFFHLLWVIQFFFYFGYLVFAGATADWYFTSYNSDGKKPRGMGEGELSRIPIIKSCCRSFKYHLGTVSLCALIIAIVQFIRYMIMYIEAQTKGDPPSKIQKAIFCAIHIYLKCLECCLDKLNRNALIWTAIWGDGFFTAACAAFGLLWRNLGRVAAINTVSFSLLLLSKVAVAAINTAAFGAFFNYNPAVEVSSWMAPCLVIFVASYGISHIFMAVFQAIIDTIFICFLVDCEQNEHVGMLASKSLQKIIGAYSEESEKIAAGAKRRAGARPGNDDGNKIEVRPKTG